MVKSSSSDGSGGPRPRKTLGAWSEADLEGLDQIFGRPVSPISALAGSSRGVDARDLVGAPDFAVLGDLGIHLSLSERATLAAAAPDEEGETDSSLESDSSPEISVREALGEAARGLEEEAAEDEERRYERDLDLAYEEWVHFMDQLAGLVPEFDFASYLVVCPYEQIPRKGDIFWQAEPSEWPCYSDA